ncbi:MAG: phosphate acyltransferase PlsX [Planctomycetota bacterium]
MGITISLDAMGGDHAPAAAVKGAVGFATENPDVTLLLVGRSEELKKLLDAGTARPSANIEIIHAAEVVGMGDPPVESIKEKKDSSITRAVELVHAGRAQAVVSGGNTGVLVAQATLGLKRIEGIKRPGIIVPLPSEKGLIYLIDAGANPESKPEYLFQHAIIGAIYCKCLTGRPRPVVGVLNIGTEEGKGNAVVQEAHRMLAALKAPLFEYRGFIEGTDLFSGAVDLVVTDGFVGNIAMKVAEGTAHSLFRMIKKEVTRTPIRKLGAGLLKGAFKDLKEYTSSETYGSAMVIGVNGITMKVHGSASARAFHNGLNSTLGLCRSDITARIRESIQALDRGDAA